MKRRLIAVLLAMTMLVSLTACGSTSTGDSSGSNESNTSSEEAEETNSDAVQSSTTTVGADGTVTTEYEEAEVETELELPAFKILVEYGTFTDKLGSQYKAALEYLAEPLNIEFTFLEIGNDSEDALNALQAALVSGYDGAIGVYATETYAGMHEDYNTPYVVSGGMPSTDEQAATMATYEMYLGSVVVDDYAAGKAMADSLYERGCRNVMWTGMSRGFSGQHDQRSYGFEDGVASHEDMNLIYESWSYSSWTDDIATAASTYPELDGVACTALSEAIYNTVEMEGLLGTVLLAGIDITESTGKVFEEDGLAYIAGGNYATELISFAVLYNYLLDGTRVIADPTVNLMLNNIDLKSIDDYNNYITYLDSGIPAYTAQEILEMTHYYDETFDADAMTAVGASYSLEDVMARHADLY